MPATIPPPAVCRSVCSDVLFSCNSETLRWAASTGRFYFHKDTACATQPIREKLAAVKEFPNFKFFNANAATLLFSLQLGAAGFSGTFVV